MPTYEYHCSDCNSNFDEFRGIKDEPLTKCSLCNKKGKIQRVISPPAMEFKGSGWPTKLDKISRARKRENSRSS